MKEILGNRGDRTDWTGLPCSGSNLPDGRSDPASPWVPGTAYEHEAQGRGGPPSRPTRPRHPIASPGNGALGITAQKTRHGLRNGIRSESGPRVPKVAGYRRTHGLAGRWGTGRLLHGKIRGGRSWVPSDRLWEDWNPRRPGATGFQARFPLGSAAGASHTPGGTSSTQNAQRGTRRQVPRSLDCMDREGLWCGF